jgi:flagellar export protein FliJ
MMAFHFQFETLLHLRTLMEQQALDKLEQCIARLRTWQRSVDDAKRWSTQTARIRARKKLLPACELHRVDEVLRQTQAAVRDYEQRIADETRMAEKLRAEYLTARSQRETVSTLRDQAARMYQIETSRRAQSALDEWFLSRLPASKNVTADEPESRS